MKIITINMHKHILKLLDVIVDKDYAPNRSEAIRRLLEFAIPHFLGLQTVYEKMINGAKIPKFKEPQYEKLTLAELRKEFADIPDFKFINEELIIV